MSHLETLADTGLYGTVFFIIECSLSFITNVSPLPSIFLLYIFMTVAFFAVIHDMRRYNA